MSHTPSRAEADRQLHDALLSMQERMRSVFHARLRELDLSPPQAGTLRMLDEPLPLRALADAHGCDASNITGIADRLEERGLVERQTDPDDRRVKLLALTAAGRAARDRMDRPMSDAFPGIARLTIAERMQLAELLQRSLRDPSGTSGRDRAPDAFGRGRHLHVAHAEVSEGVDHGRLDRRRRPDGA